MIPPRFRVCLKWIQWLAVASIFVACAPSRSVIDVGGWSQWKQSRVPSRCPREFVVGVSGEWPSRCWEMDSVVLHRLGCPTLDGFGKRLNATLRFDVCGARPPVVVVRLGNLEGSGEKFDPLDSLVLPGLPDSVLNVPVGTSKMSAEARIVLIGQEAIAPWSARIAPLVRLASDESGRIDPSRRRRSWLLANTWRSDDRRELSIELDMRVNGARLRDTILVDPLAHRLSLGRRQ